MKEVEQRAERAGRQVPNSGVGFRLAFIGGGERDERRPRGQPRRGELEEATGFRLKVKTTNEEGRMPGGGFAPMLNEKRPAKKTAEDVLDAFAGQLEETLLSAMAKAAAEATPPGGGEETVENARGGDYEELTDEEAVAALKRITNAAGDWQVETGEAEHA